MDFSISWNYSPDHTYCLPTNGFSKKIENLEYALALHFMQYNFARVLKTLTNPYPRDQAMAAGISDHIWTVEEIMKLVDN